MESPKRVRLYGSPVAHSVSPAFQNAAFQEARVGALYEAMDVSRSQLAEVRDQLVLGTLHGANMTSPHKVSALALADECSPVAVAIEATNTLWKRATGRIVASNTDVAGVEASIRSLCAPADGLPGGATILGAGGAAAAAALACRQLGLRTVVVCRSPQEVASQPISRHCDQILPWQADSVEMAMGECDGLIIDATSIGALSPERAEAAWSTLGLASVPPTSMAMTMAYGTAASAFSGHVAHLDKPCLDGRTMLLHQGAVSFALWFNVEPPLVRMRDALQAATTGAGHGSLVLHPDVVMRHTELERLSS